MRHVLGLRDWQAWREGESEDIVRSAVPDSSAQRIDWDGWMQKMRGTGENGTWERTGPMLDQDIEGSDEEDEEASEGEEGSGGKEEGEDEDEKNIDEEEEEEEEEAKGEDHDSEDEIGEGSRGGLFNRFAHAV